MRGEGYSGRANFEFEIERYKDKETGEFFTEDKLPDCDDESFEFEITLIKLKVSGNLYYEPGRYDGPYEKCYPDERDTEIEEIIDEHGNDWSSHLTKHELNEIVEKIVEQSSDHDDFDLPEQDYDCL